MRCALAPLFFLGIIAGTIADMVDRRLLIRALNMCMALLLIGIGTLIFNDLLQVWHLLAFSVLGGCIMAVHQSARQSFAFDVVGREYLMGGLAYVGLGMRLGGLVGSIVAGYLIKGRRRGHSVLGARQRICRLHAAAEPDTLARTGGTLPAADIAKLARVRGRAAAQ